MRFVCESCQAQYMISEDKLGPKGARVKCKKCGHVIVLRKTENPPAESAPAEVAPAAAPPPAADPASAESPTTAGGTPKKLISAAEILDGVEDDEIGAVFDQALTETDAPSPAEGVPPPQAAPAAASEEHAPSTLSNVPAGPAPVYDWFVAINDQQVGPITQDKVKQLWDSGEVGPDSLCWRAGLADWKPLREVRELSSTLVPRPTKPVIIAPAAPATPAAPVESVFATAPKAERKEIPTPAAATPAPDSGGWRPSAATTLATLLQEEMKVLHTPAPMPAAVPQAAQAVRPITASSPLMQAPAFDAPVGAVPMPRFGAYAETRSKKGLIFAGVAGGLVVGAAVAVTLYFSRPAPPSPPPTASVQNPPAPEASKPVPPTANPASSPSAVAAAAPKPVDQKTEATVATRIEPPPAPPPYEGDRSGNHRDRRHRSRSSSEQSSSSSKPENGEKVARAVEPPREASDDEFQKEFGGGGERAAGRSEKKSVYVPPAPGSASADLPESLGQSDIMSVVVQNKPSILGCVSEQRKRDSSLSGRMVMRWQIHTNGKTSNVSCQTDEFKGTPLASCIGGLIKTWTFPRHKIQGEPINFPFTF